MRNNGILQTLLVVLDAFLAATAVVGGVGLMTGQLAPGLALLEGSPFRSYLIPGMALLVLVGGSALAAALLMQRRHCYGALASAVAGIMILGFEIVEVVAIGSPAGLARNLQLFYIALGLVIAGLAIRLWWSERGDSFGTRHEPG